MNDYPEELFVVKDQGKDETWYWAHTNVEKCVEAGEMKRVGIYQLVKVVMVSSYAKVEDA